ncbi:MAG: NAD(P)/FAD-dependent oxidoreductase [Deltaproteobacteria bacterium]|nr:NAD(P)/FAD-dependent oxidoreductase [Deltaproteobacteria bacterium]
MTDPAASETAPPPKAVRDPKKGADRVRYWHKTMPEGPWDVIVIGSGMGGMTAGAMLSKLGKRVLILEQHYVPGGFTHEFNRKGSRKGWNWDVGVHAVGEVTQHTMPGRLLHTLTDGRLEWESLGPTYDEFTFPEGKRVAFPNTPDAFRANLIDAFPDGQEAIDEYLGLVKQVSKGMRGYYLARTLPRWAAPIADRTLGRRAGKWLDVTTAEVLDRVTDDPKLKMLLAAQWGYYGSTPSRSSFAMQALVTKHFLHGGYYPRGGSAAIARELLRTVAEAGGWTRIRADVQEILIEEGKAVGVRLPEGEEIRAPRILSAAGVQATVRNLLPEVQRSKPWAKSIEALKPAPCHVCLYLGFKGDIRQGGASAANQWFYDTWDPEDDNWEVAPDIQDLPNANVLYCSFPSLKNPEHDPGQDERHTGEVVTFVPWESFAKWQGTPWSERGPEYEAFKERMHDSLVEQFLSKMPGLRQHLVFSELSTPLSTDHFVRPSRGSIYGLEPTPERFRNQNLRPRSPIPNLFFGGSEVSSVGVIGAMMGGVLAVAAMEPRAAMKMMG